MRNEVLHHQMELYRPITAPKYEERGKIYFQTTKKTYSSRGHRGIVVFVRILIRFRLFTGLFSQCGI